MSVSQHELDRFHEFASRELAGRRDLNLEDLVSQWRADQERSETVASVRRGVQDADAGRLSDLADVDAKVRSELGFPPRGR